MNEFCKMWIVLVLIAALAITIWVTIETTADYYRTKAYLNAGMCQELVSPDTYYHTGVTYVWKKCS